MPVGPSEPVGGQNSIGEIGDPVMMLESINLLPTVSAAAASLPHRPKDRPWSRWGPDSDLGAIQAYEDDDMGGNTQGRWKVMR